MWVVRGVPLFGPHFFNSSSLASHVNEISLFEGKKLPYSSSFDPFIEETTECMLLLILLNLLLRL